MSTMTIFEGLTQLKLLKTRIEQATNELTVVTVVQGSQSPAGYRSVGEFIDRAESTLQSVQDLITRRARIKSALVRSNASTVVKVNGVEMTVAEAIELKNSIEFKKNLLDKIKKMWYNGVSVVERNNAQVQQQANQHVGQMFGKDNPPDQAQFDSLVKAFLGSNLYKVVYPNNLQNIIEKLEQEINGFLSEVDARLNESNAITLIEVQD